MRGASPSSTPILAGSLIAHDFLVDRAEDRAALRVLHLDAHAVAEFEEWRLGRAPFDGLDHAPLREAGGACRGITVGDRAGADDGAGLELARLRGMRDQHREIEIHVAAGVGLTEEGA